MQTGPTIDAAFSGFRLARERSRAIAIWAALCLAFSLAEGVFAAATAGPGMMRILALARQVNPNLDEVIYRLAQIAPTYLVIVAANIAFYAILFAAANRAAWQPDDQRFGYLRFGVDELRQVGMLGLLLLVTVVAYVALGLIASLAGAAAAIAGGPGAGLVLAAVFVIVGLGYLWMRLSLASPITFATGRIDVFGSWALTRGRQWAVARIYLLAFALTVVVYFVGLTFIVAVMAALTGGVSGLMMLAAPDLSSIAAFLTPPRLALLGLQAGLSALILPIVLCPAVEVYRQLALNPRAATGWASQPNDPWA